MIPFYDLNRTSQFRRLTSLAPEFSAYTPRFLAIRGPKIERYLRAAKSA